jgi:hypothetical protein
VRLLEKWRSCSLASRESEAMVDDKTIGRSAVASPQSSSWKWLKLAYFRERVIPIPIGHLYPLLATSYDGAILHVFLARPAIRWIAAGVCVEADFLTTEP